MLQDLDNASPAAQSMQERALALLFRLQEMTAFLLPELTALDPVRLREVAERRPELRDFRHMIDNVIRSRAHVLSAREEQLLAMAAPALESMDNAFFFHAQQRGSRPRRGGGRGRKPGES